MAPAMDMGDTIAVIILLIVPLGALFTYWYFSHPLVCYRGPFLWSLSRLPQTYYLFRGTLPWKIHKLHEEYGPVIRIAPNELSYTTPGAWHDIYGKGKDGSQLRKDLSFAASAASTTGANSILFEFDDTEHARLRRNMSHVFSSKNLRAQEPIILKYINQFIDLLKSRGDEPVNISEMFNFLTFDITGDMVFGDSFNCLTSESLHPWIKFIFARVSGAALFGAVNKLWPFSFLFTPFIPKHLRHGDLKHAALSKEKLDQRLEKQDPRPDFITHLQKKPGKEYGMSYEEIVENSRTLIVGGAETTATLLTGLIYYLGSFHHMLLRNLIRMAFSSAERITLEGLKIVEEGDRRKPEKAYIDACIYEALRMFPPLPGNLRRVVPEGGKIIAGRWVPGGTLVAVAILAANLSTRNFHRPNEFRPERWFKAVDPTTKHAAFDGDKLNVVQAFSFGPRNCIGKNLALMEMRLIITTFLWHFDMTIEEESKGWIDRVRAYGFFLKPKLMVKLNYRGGELDIPDPSHYDYSDPEDGSDGEGGSDGVAFRSSCRLCSLRDSTDQSKEDKE